MKKQSLLQFEIKKESSKKQIIIHDHPSTVIETPSLTSVDLPDAWYNPDLPEETVNSGALSALQLETVIYSCQRHEQKLADGSRAGYLIGDGAGVGKGRMAAGIIFENFLQGRKKAIWFSVSTDLKYDAERDLRDIGADQITVHAFNQLKNSSAPTDAIESIKEGVLFSTYSDLIAELRITSKKKLSCLEQFLKWCGQDFDGVVIFDECHHMNNINYSGSRNARKIELAFLELQNKMPNARIIYISTTAISEPRSMASMIRLGLWGQETPFHDFGQFLETVKKFGEIAGDIIATDMKRRGLSVNRQLSFNNVTFGIAEVCLLPKCILNYNSSVKLWIELLQSFTEAVELADLGPKTQKIMWTNFWSAHRKFFRCLCISAKVAHAVKLASEAVKRGECVVIGLQSTGESYTLQKIPKDGRYKRITNFVSTSKVIMQSLVEKYFPASDSLQLLADETRNNRERTVGGKRKCVTKTAGTPKKKKSELTNDSPSETIDSRDACASAPLFDYDSDPIDFKLEDEELVEDRKTKLVKASLIKQRLLEKIEELGATLPPNWFDHLIDELGGSDNVAEISTRKGRVVQKINGLIQYESRSETDVSLEFINIRERERFMDGEKNIAIVSAAATSGISLQADRRVKNQRHRVYISLELPNNAEFALQQFGCIHRSNQVRAPEFIFLVSEFAGDRRSALILANRLQCLGATYKNELLNKGPFKFNLDEIKAYDCAVLDTVNIFMGRKSPIVPVPVDYKDIKSALAEVSIISSNLLFPTKGEANVPEILNRILGISVELQATLLQYFIDVQSTINNRAKIDSHNDMKILDLGIDKCVYHTKLLRFISKNPIAPIPVKIELHEFEVDGGMSWRTAEEKWIPKSDRQAHEGFYLSKEVTMCYGKRDIILVRRIQTADEGADKGNLNYTVIRPSMGVQPLPQSLDQIKQNYTPQNSFLKSANIEDMKLLWNFHYDASKNNCIHAYWRKSKSKKKHPEGCQEGLRLNAKYKLLSGSIYLVWKKIESLLRENKQSKVQIARVQVESTSIVGVVIPANCETELVNIMTALYSKKNFIIN